jgi:hypothetical protein
MADQEDREFGQFVIERKKDLQRIARSTRREHQFSDMRAEAWLMARNWRDKKGIPANFLDVDYQQLLLSHLYQHLVRYTDLHVRHAVRLDHTPQGTMEEDASNPLMHKLADSSCPDPLAMLIEPGSSCRQNDEPDCHHSPASAWLHLLRHFDNRMRAIAHHLLISVSHGYRCCAKARSFAWHQHPIPLTVRTDGNTFLPGAWRRFRMCRIPVQLAFGFDEDQALWPFPSDHSRFEGTSEKQQ